MPRLTPQQRAEAEAQRAALQKQLEDDDAAAADDDAEDWYDLSSGDKSFRVRAGSKAGKRAHSWVKENFGIDLDDEDVQDDDDDDADEPAGKPAARKKAPADPPPPGNVRAFGRTVAAR